jgi:Ca2+-dependent lipid-binding protein
MRSVSDLRSSQSTLSAAAAAAATAPIPNSKSQISIASSHSSQKSTVSKKSKDSDTPLTREEIIAAYLEKAKWYTSVGLGMAHKMHSFLSTHLSFTGTTAILSVFAFLFLIPFVVDPAISALTLDFQSGKNIFSNIVKQH